MPAKPTLSGRVELRLKVEDKAVLARAAAIKGQDLTSFILGRVLPEARDIVDRGDVIQLGKRDSLFVIDLLENPPPPTDKLREVARRLLRQRKS